MNKIACEAWAGAKPADHDDPGTEQAADRDRGAAVREARPVTQATQAVAGALGNLWQRGKQAVLSGVSARERRRWVAQLRVCLLAGQTDGAANQLARDWQQQYRQADAEQRRALVLALAEASASLDKGGASAPALSLSQALESARVRFFKRLNALPDGLAFLVALRADLLRWLRQTPELIALDADLEGLFSTWFDVGLLELRRLTWDSPASLLEKLIVYEAVHPIRSWNDLRNRVDDGRRCYAFFHARMPSEPLIFVEVAFDTEMSAHIQRLLDESAPRQAPARARWAIFYSISNTQAGLRGVSFGNFLLKRVIEDLQQDFPKLKSFATLSPIPGFANWLRTQSAPAIAAIVGDALLAAAGPDGEATGARRDVERPDGAQVDRLLCAWATRQPLPHGASGAAERERDAAREKLAMSLAAHYLARERRGNGPLDAVARFHLGNGARIERLNWRGDTSPKGLAQSCAMMVNYQYELDKLDANLKQLHAGRPAVSRMVGRLLA